MAAIASTRVLPEEEIFRQADLLTELLAPIYRVAFLRAIFRTIQGTNLTLLATALAREDVELAVSAIPWNILSQELGPLYTGTSPLLGAAMRGGAVIGERLLPPALQRELSLTAFEAIQPKAIAWLSDHGAETIADLAAESRAGIRHLLISAFEEPLSVADSSRLMLEILQAPQVGGLVGVTRWQAEQLTRKMKDLAEDPGLSVKQIQRAVDREHEQMMRIRAETEAQTEIKAAGNEAQLQVFEQALEDGKLDIRGLRLPFTGDSYEVKGEKVADPAVRPPLHQRCYCQFRTVAIGAGVYTLEWVTRTYGVCERCQRMDGKRAGGL